MKKWLFILVAFFALPLFAGNDAGRFDGTQSILGTDSAWTTLQCTTITGSLARFVIVRGSTVVSDTNKSDYYTSKDNGATDTATWLVYIKVNKNIIVGPDSTISVAVTFVDTVRAWHNGNIVFPDSLLINLALIDSLFGDTLFYNDGRIDDLYLDSVFSIDGLAIYFADSIKGPRADFDSLSADTFDVDKFSANKAYLDSLRAISGNLYISASGSTKVLSGLLYSAGNVEAADSAIAPFHGAKPGFNVQFGWGSTGVLACTLMFGTDTTYIMFGPNNAPKEIWCGDQGYFMVNKTKGDTSRFYIKEGGNRDTLFITLPDSFVSRFATYGDHGGGYAVDESTHTAASESVWYSVNLDTTHSTDQEYVFDPDSSYVTTPKFGHVKLDASINYSDIVLNETFSFAFFINRTTEVAMSRITLEGGVVAAIDAVSLLAIVDLEAGDTVEIRYRSEEGADAFVVDNDVFTIFKLHD